MNRRVLLAAALASGCNGIVGPAVREVDWPEWNQELGRAVGAPVAAYLWAPWSRASMELLPTVVELEREWEEAGILFFYLCFGPGGEYPAELGARGRLFRWSLDFSDAESLIGIHELPVALVYDRAGELRHTLGGHERDPLMPEDFADAIEAALTG